MTKAAQREQRRAQRIARRNRQRIILVIIIALVVVVVGYVIYQSTTSSSSSNSYPIGTLDTTPPEPSANAVTTASGLVYEDLQVGDGTAAKAGDTVSVHYTGWLEDGTKFDSSIDRGQPFEFSLGTGAVIAGWDEGVAGMQENGTRLLVIPPELGYGTNANGQIPANSTLIFEVQLIDVK